MPRVVIVHDYLTQRGGAERVVLALAGIFPEAPILTSLFDHGGTFPEFQNLDVRPQMINRIGALRRDPRRALPVLASVFSSISIPDADVVLCSSSGWAHGIRTRSKKIVYCYTPPRWLYQTDEYLARHGRSVRAGLALLRPRLVAWDRRHALTADRYLAISNTVAERIHAAYGIDAEVLAPPVSYMADSDRLKMPGIAPGYFLTVARGRAYKHVELVCEAIESIPGARLVVVGELPPRPGGGSWSNRIQGVGTILDGHLRWLYANCAGTVTASNEDFGLTPLEGNAFGKPAAVLRAGGFLDTLVDGVTGTFIEDLSAEAVARAVRTLSDLQDCEALVRHARGFGVERFAERLRDIVEEVGAAHARGSTLQSERN